MQAALIRTTKVYGNGVIYPANPTAQHLANLAGTRTLTPQGLREIIAAGLQVQQVFPNGDHLTVESIDDVIYV